MTTLGIFGDSFADPSHGHNGLRDTMDWDGWMFHLGGHYKPFIYARGGGSVYYAYKKFIENHQKHDKNIFFVTTPHRIFHTNLTWPSGEEATIPGYRSACYLEKSNIFEYTNEHKKKIQAVKDWYLYLMHDETQYDLCRAMLHKVKTLRPDTLFINIFYNPFGPDNGKPMYPEILGPCMNEYLDTFISSITDTSKFDWPYMAVGGRIEKRLTCHLSKEMNLIVAKDICHALDTGVWNPVIPKFVPHANTDLSYYYTDEYEDQYMEKI